MRNTALQRVKVNAGLGRSPGADLICQHQYSVASKPSVPRERPEPPAAIPGSPFPVLPPFTGGGEHCFNRSALERALGVCWAGAAFFQLLGPRLRCKEGRSGRADCSGRRPGENANYKGLVCPPEELAHLPVFHLWERCSHVTQMRKSPGLPREFC